jgi:hypothetical protein
VKNATSACSTRPSASPTALVGVLPVAMSTTADSTLTWGSTTRRFLRRRCERGHDVCGWHARTRVVRRSSNSQTPELRAGTTQHTERVVPRTHQQRLHLVLSAGRGAAAGCRGWLCHGGRRLLLLRLLLLLRDVCGCATEQLSGGVQRGSTMQNPSPPPATQPTCLPPKPLLFAAAAGVRVRPRCRRLSTCGVGGRVGAVFGSAAARQPGDSGVARRTSAGRAVITCRCCCCCWGERALVLLSAAPLMLLL